MPSKKILVLLFIVSLLALFLTYLYTNNIKTNSNRETQKTKNVLQNENKKTLQFNVSGMTCTQCESKIMAIQDTTPGIYSIQVSYSDGRGYVKYDGSQLTETKILEAIRLLGYSASKRRPIRIESVDYKVQFKAK